MRTKTCLEMQLHKLVEALNVEGVKACLDDPVFDPCAHPDGFEASWNVATAAIVTIGDKINDAEQNQDDARHILAILMADPRIGKTCHDMIWDMYAPLGRVWDLETNTGRTISPDEF